MKILFLTLVNIDSIEDRNIYTDLMREFSKNGDDIYIVSPSERRFKKPTRLIREEKSSILKVRILNNQKTNLIEKGISTILLEYQYLNAIKKHLSDIKFDCVVYSTPPITFEKVINFVKKRDGAKSYLLLKDIFPQNAVDLGMLKRDGFLYRYFRNKESKLYEISDHIGCMSPANAKYVLQHNPKLDASKVEINPNSIELENSEEIIKNVDSIRNRYGIPKGVKTFVYGGNLGKPQGIDFLIEILSSNINRKDCFFVIVGSGTEYIKLEQWFYKFKPTNAILISSLPKSEYDELVRSCNIGLIFLNKNFTIPNFPSRLLSYLEYKIPVLAATDVNTDIGKIAEENKFGYWVESGNIVLFNKYVDAFCSNNQIVKEFGQNGYNFLKENYTVENSFRIIKKHLL
ncbi:MAG: glycosyltransferase family 4 protein [Marinifilaceae bacterium]